MTRLAHPVARASSSVRALVCDAGVLEPASSQAALGRARAAGLRLGIVHDRLPPWTVMRQAAEQGDVIAVPRPDERTPGRTDEVRPAFVLRVCGRLGVPPAACLVVSGRRPLLAAAVWAGSRTVMVPDATTPLFDLRAQRSLAADVAAAVDGVLAAGGVR